MERKSMYKGSKIRIDDDYKIEIRLKRKQLVKYMWEARGRGKHAVLVGDKIEIDGAVDLEFCEKNLNTGAETSSMREREREREREQFHRLD